MKFLNTEVGKSVGKGWNFIFHRGGREGEVELLYSQ